MKATLSEILGSVTQIYGSLSGVSCVIQVPGRVKVIEGQELSLVIPPEKIHLFASGSEISILSDGEGNLLSAPAVRQK